MERKMSDSPHGSSRNTLLPRSGNRCCLQNRDIHELDLSIASYRYVGQTTCQRGHLIEALKQFHYADMDSLHPTLGGRFDDYYWMFR